jgi:hypothetical protein
MRWSCPAGGTTTPCGGGSPVFAAILPLRRRSELDSPALRKRVLAISDGVTNRIFRLIEVVAVNAVKSGAERIDAASFAAGDLVLPLVS